jgi:hypothetical protein
VAVGWQPAEVCGWVGGWRVGMQGAAGVSACAVGVRSAPRPPTPLLWRNERAGTPWRPKQRRTDAQHAHARTSAGYSPRHRLWRDVQAIHAAHMAQTAHPSPGGFAKGVRWVYVMK